MFDFQIVLIDSQKYLLVFKSKFDSNSIKTIWIKQILIKIVSKVFELKIFEYQKLLIAFACVSYGDQTSFLPYVSHLLSLDGLTFFKTALGYGYGFSYETGLQLRLLFQVCSKPVKTGKNRSQLTVSSGVFPSENRFSTGFYRFTRGKTAKIW